MSRYVNIENARIIFRNFSGKEGKYNRAGERSFAVILDGDVSGLVDEGWNIKYLKPREEDEQPIPYISVSVRYDFAPPKIYAVTDGRPVLLDEEAVGELDYADISFCDMVVSPYRWEVNGKSGVKAYLKTLYANIEKDPYAAKYSDENGNMPF